MPLMHLRVQKPFEKTKALRRIGRCSGGLAAFQKRYGFVGVRFSYSLDGIAWTSIGRPSRLTYTVPHFMGNRFALFIYSTKTAGGRVDFDYDRIGQGDGSR